MTAIKLIIVLFALIGLSAKGQVSITHVIQDSILYTIYSPDTILSVGSSHDTTATLFFDVNNDGINDFELFYYYLFKDSTSWDIKEEITPIDTLHNTWYIACFGDPDCPDSIVLGLDSSQVIADTLVWANDGANFLNVSDPNILCYYNLNYGFYYYPIKLINSDGNIYFGWICLSYVDSSILKDSIILKETAICQIPNQPIYTGHRGLYTGINNLSASYNNLISIYPNPTTSKFTLSSKVETIREIKVINVLGEIIYESTIDNLKAIIDLGIVAKGIYFVEITDYSYNISNLKITIQ